MDTPFVADNLESKDVQDEATQNGLTIGEASTQQLPCGIRTR